ncbi:GntR family transcriptional regulator [Enterococcus villorum]|uniref:GntR family transcriptional regulator n=1 Tax=Enterococcus villorum TaxID=112904 RepID=A0A1V8Y7A3_9ENTE|nr:PLP-dependent aminotransferase family protein [Enterococcus villorum]OQO68498.1 GntR family transcriptional regulator [Enterococcus villorum]OQO74430.1 GntR family transcriptional regulator [Enterococcus villorum]
MPINSYDDYPITWRPDKTKLTRPIYQSLIQQLEEDILTNKLQKNTQLPSQRELADYLDINFTTVGQAYKYGIEKGLLYTNIGSGTFVSPNAFTSITISTNHVAEHVIDFGLVSSFEECNHFVVPFIHSVSNNPNVVGLLNYREPMGTNFQLKTAVEWLQTQGVRTTIQQTAIISGVQNGLAITLAALFTPRDRIAVDRYTYSNFIELAHLYHLEIVPIDFDQEGMIPELLLQECRKKKIKGLYLMPSCNNPVGFQLSFNRREELKKIILKEQLLVIEDDIHSFLTTYFQKKVLPPFQQLLPNQTVYLSGMTKFICSGLRVAYLVFPEHLRKKIEQAIFNINVKTSGLDAEIITQVLRSSETVQKIRMTKFARTKEANKRFDTYFDLPRPSNPYPFYRNIPISPEISPSVVEKNFLEKGIRLYHSNRFTSQQQPDPFIRIALSSNHLEILEKGLRIIKEEIKNYQ